MVVVGVVPSLVMVETVPELHATTVSPTTTPRQVTSRGNLLHDDVLRITKLFQSNLGLETGYWGVPSVSICRKSSYQLLGIFGEKSRIAAGAHRLAHPE